MTIRAAALGLVAILSGLQTAAQAADDPLKVCLDEDRPPFSSHQRGKPGTGFDVALAQAIADRLGRPLKIQWFESKLDEDSSPQLEANALLSDGRCSFVSGYALTRDSLVVPGVKTAKLPDFEGATRDDRRRRVELGVLTPSQPYIYSPLTVVLGPKARGRKISDIGDLSGLRLAIESGSLGDAILMSFEKGRLIENITHLVPGRDDLLVRSSVATTMRRCSISPASMPIAQRTATRACRLQAIIIRLAPIAVMSRLQAIRHCSPRSTRRWPICRPKARS